MKTLKIVLVTGLIFPTNIPDGYIEGRIIKK